MFLLILDVILLFCTQVHLVDQAMEAGNIRMGFFRFPTSPTFVESIDGAPSSVQIALNFSSLIAKVWNTFFKLSYTSIPRVLPYRGMQYKIFSVIP